MASSVTVQGGQTRPVALLVSTLPLSQFLHHGYILNIMALDCVLLAAEVARWVVRLHVEAEGLLVRQLVALQEAVLQRPQLPQLHGDGA